MNVRRGLPLVLLVACGAPRATPTAADAGSGVPSASAPKPRVEVDAAAPAAAAFEGSEEPLGLRCLVDHLGGSIARDEFGWSLVLAKGRFTWDDGQSKTTSARIASPDLEDTFALGYPSHPVRPVTDEEEDPGRVRHEPLLRAVYGDGARAVSASLVSLVFAGHSVLVHRRAAEALARVDRRVTAIVHDDPKLARFVRTLGGTFAVRTIAGTDRTSAHAWGIAIDLDPSVSDYWRDHVSPTTTKLTWKNRLPEVFVDAFEAEGFAWGGRWYHYDTMHFEYRPELLDPRCRTPHPNR